MKGEYLSGPEGGPFEHNIYANKSALVLAWLLEKGSSLESFSLRDIVRDAQVSLGLVQKVLKQLHWNGFIESQGSNTARKFFVPKPARLLKEWSNHYNIIKRCKIRSYTTSLSTNRERFQALRSMKIGSRGVVTLHAAAELYKKKNTNLETFELYILDDGAKEEVIKRLCLEPCERGYDVLLIEPFYKSLLEERYLSDLEGVKVASFLLTFLDLFHFPLRGPEQAEFLLQRVPELNFEKE